MLQRKYTNAVWFLAFGLSVLVSACGGSGTAPSAYSVSGTVTGLTGTSLVLQNNGSDDLTVVANGRFTFKTSVADGANFAVSVLTQPTSPTQTCTVNNGIGTIAGTDLTSVSVVCSTNAYTVSGSVTGLTGTGLVLQNNGGDFLNITGNGTFTFATPVASGANYSVEVHTLPSGPFQACTVTGGAGIVGGADVAGLAINCAGPLPRYAFVSNYGGNTVSVFVADAQTGSLTHISTAATGVQPWSVTVDPTGQYLYVANNGNPCAGGSVSQYTVGANGLLTPMSTATVAAGANPMFIAMDPLGKYVYVANQCSNTISQYTIDADGSLTPMATPTAPTGSSPNSITIDAAGKYAYVANMGNTVSQYTIRSDGSFAPMTTPSVAAGVTPVSVTVDPTGKYAYVANHGGGTISQYMIGADGGLVPMATPSVAATNPQTVTIDPMGKYAYVANYSFSGSVSQFIIGESGGLIPMTTPSVPAGSYSRDIIVDPSGKYAYVANSGDASIWQYTIGTDGGLIPMTTTIAGTGSIPTSIVTAGARR